MKTRFFFSLVAAMTLVVAFAIPAAAEDGTYTATLSQMNGSGTSGDVSIELNGTTADVTVTVNGASPDGSPHAQHLHGEFGADNTCPTDDADTDGDGLVNVVEGVPSYGGVKVSVTTEGDTTADSALAVERFPAGTDGSYTFTRTFELDQESADNLGSLVFVVHGIDLDGSGQYDGDAPSSLNPDLPLEATIPAACGQIAFAAAPSGGVDTGAGGAADSGNTALYVALGLAAAAATGGLALRRRSVES